MTHETVYSDGDPHQLLSNARELARRVLKVQRAAWFPLLVFAALSFASVLIRRSTGHHLDCAATLGGRICRVYSDTDFVYWPTALVLAYVAIATFYIRRSLARGVGTRVRPYAIAGILIAAALTAAALWELHHPAAHQNSLGLNGLLYRLAGPGTAIGLALLVLAWGERDLVLFLLTVAYLSVVLVPITFGVAQWNPPWYSQPAISQGSVLLLGSLGLALAQRPLRTPTP